MWSLAARTLKATERMNPFVSTPPPDVPLGRAPLEVVIAGVRFPDVLSLAGAGSDVVARLQTELSTSFPTVRTEHLQLTYGEDANPMIIHPVWRFHNDDDTVRLSVAKHGFTLETKRYRGRDPFVESFSELFDTLQRVLDVPMKSIDQISMRYVNRIAAPELERVPDFVNPKLLGMSEFVVDDGGQGGNSIGTTQFALPGTESRMSVFRYGRVRGGQSVDPSTVAIIDSPSWMLDIDIARISPMILARSTTVMRDELNVLAERAYTIFRWAVTDEFLSHYGGDA